MKAEGYVVDPPIGRDAHNLLYRANRFYRMHRAAYPLALDSDQRGAEVAVAGGYAERLLDDPHFVRVTQKGRLYLQAVMRAH
ncbi:hypothetical protein FHX08_002050 [Rhizobium sp. BK529]|uniref:hypothetical protein n=1 Tax=Rhizobium sp. BK529 TaxID=2586983 RepID=UPI001613A557|nr:hypothetical protein [Rhizobium sp. BK529]MBB3591706.1 hypothetical protein [Rhizobium sp. BK529]